MKMPLAAAAAALVLCAGLPQVSQARAVIQVRRVSSQISLGLRDGSLTRREARDLRLKLINIELLQAHDMRGGGISKAQTQDVDMRYAALAEQVHAERINARHTAPRRQPVHPST